MASELAVAEATASDRASGHGSPDTSTRGDNAEVQRDNGDDTVLPSTSSPSSPSSPFPSGDAAALAPSPAKPDGPEASDENSTVVPAKSTTETGTNPTSGPPLPDEPVPPAEDDGWDCHWDAAHQAWFFYNRITNESTWDNPRVPSQPQASADTNANAQLETPPATAVPPVNERLPAGGYNPAIHGDYDPNAWYAKNDNEDEEGEVSVMDPATAYAAIGTFNRFTGRWQGDDQNPDRHSDEAKSRRQMNAIFDFDAAANAHDGRSLKAERSGKKPTKSELRHFKEKRRAKKEEKRRAWLRD
ncbi:hypothetical protein F4777DRAFT_290024 [Nemania sp. FL0916]|nr:hypothetical protein F4777DRAFT_290024 [Nemania sp. FL0916]